MAEMVPQGVELVGEFFDEFWVVGDDDVFVVDHGGGAGPVVAAGEEVAVVGDREFVVHVGLGAVESTFDSHAEEAVKVGAVVFGFVVVRDDADVDLAVDGLGEDFDNAVVGDGEDADVEGLLSFVDEAADAVEAVVARAEVGVGLDFVFARVEELDDALEPVHSGDLAELLNALVGKLKGELAGLGLGGGVTGEFCDVDLELLLFRSTEGVVFERRGEKGFEFGHGKELKRSIVC